MKAIQSADLKNNQEKILDLADNGEIVLIARPAKNNIIVLSEAEFNRREKALRNAEYLAKLDMSIKQAENGEVVRYSKEQMRAMEKE